jgi:hypothetical protein
MIPCSVHLKMALVAETCSETWLYEEYLVAIEVKFVYFESNYNSVHYSGYSPSNLKEKSQVVIQTIAYYNIFSVLEVDNMKEKNLLSQIMKILFMQTFSVFKVWDFS